MKSHSLGVLQIVLSGAMFSFIGVIGKISLSRGIDPMELLGLRFAFSTTIMVVALLALKPKLLSATSKQIMTFAVVAICGYSMMAWTFFKALETISASLTVLLLYTYPIIVAVLGHFFLKEKVAPTKIPWFALALLGLIALVYGEMEIKSAVGIGFGLVSAFTYALYILISKKLFSDVPALTSVTYIQGSAAILFLILSFSSAARLGEIINHSWGLILFFALVSTIGAMLLFLEGLKRVKSWEASILSLVEAVGGVVVSVILLGEQLKVLQLIGAALVLVCLVMIAWPKNIPAAD